MKLAILTNIASPYRVDFFYFLQTHYPEHDIHILYASAGQQGREWNTDRDKIVNSIFLTSKSITLGRGGWKRTIDFPVGVKRALSSFGPDAVVAMEYNPSALAALSWCKRHKVPFVHWTDGTLRSERRLNFVQKWSRKKIVSGADGFIASSTKAKEKLLAYGARKPIFISSLTVDVDAYSVPPQEKTGRTLLYVGGLIDRKGVDLLLNALAQVKIPVRLVAVGSGPEEDALRRRAQELGLDVCWKGFLQREGLCEEYARADAFILPTREDCFGLVMLEAMCASLPVLASRYADGAYDLVEEGVNGYFFDPEDAVGTAAVIERVFAENGGNRMGKASFARAQLFRFERVARPFLQAAVCASQKRQEDTTDRKNGKI